MRTKFQTKATAQLIARAFSIESGTLDQSACDLGVRFPRAVPIEQVNSNANGSEEKSSLPLPDNVPVNDSDVLGYIELSRGDKESVVTASDGVEAERK